MSEPAKSGASADAQGIQKLVRAGVDVKQPVSLQFVLRVPSEEDAFSAASRLEELAFATSMEQDDSRNDWVVLARKRMYPVESDLLGLRVKLEAVATECHGTYEGWQAAP